MTDEHTLEDLRHPRSIFSTWIGVVLLFVVFGLFVLVVIGAGPRGDTYEAKRAKARLDKLKAAQDEAGKALTTYGWVDKTKGVARVPIDRAMELTLAELAARKPAPANPIATPAPPNPPAPPNAAPAAPAPPQPAGAATPKPTGTYNPTGAPQGTQPGPSATPAASPGAPSAQAPQAPSPTPVPSPSATPLPVRGKTP